MAKDRKSLLEQIYDGEFYPCETAVSSDSEYQSAGQKAYDEIEYIFSRLNNADKKHFDKLLDLMSERESMHGYANFAYGFRSGMLLMLELLAIDDKQLLANHK